MITDPVDSRPLRLPRRSGTGDACRVVVCLAVVLLAQPATAGPQAVLRRLAIFRGQHAELRQDHVAALGKIRDFCLDRKINEGVQAVDAAIQLTKVPPATSIQLPNDVARDLPADLPPDQRQWQSQLRTLQRKHAQSLFVLSRRVLKAGYTSFAFDLIRETAITDPDSRTARKLLGFVRFGNRWVTPFASRQLRRRHVWHKTFGWLPATHVEKYESGQRYFKRRWVSVDREAELRRDFRNAWEVRTDHYLVRTNHSLEEGVVLAEHLETFYRFFHSSFAGFFKSPEQIQKLFEGTSRVTSGVPKLVRPHVVHYYRDREEYRRTLRQRIPQIDITNGLYMTDDRIAYFFHGQPADPLFPRATLFHEATHQLLYESQSRQRPIAHDENFWIIEGFACYMESFLPSPGGYRIGDPKYVRFHWARHRLLSEKYYIPLRTFASMGMRSFQTDPNITRNYSQASGLTHFLLHYAEGRYRDALIQHLSQIYTRDRRITIPSLSKLTGVDTTELDRQYREYLAHQESRLPTTRGRTPRQ